MKGSRRFRSRKLEFEPLESRQLMAANITAAFSGGVLTVTGSNSDDTISFLQTNGKISIKDVSGLWKAADVQSIVVNLQGGNDIVSLASAANGGGEAMSEMLTVKSGAGLERVRLNDGRDVYFGGAGNSLVLFPNNTATLNGAAANIAATANNLTNSILVTFNATTGALTVIGTNGNDNIQLVRTNNVVSIAGVSGSWPAGDVKSIAVYLQSGTDVVSLEGTANGNYQALAIPVNVYSSTGGNTVRVASNKQITFSGPNHLLKIAANTTATLDGQPATWVAPPGPPAPAPPPPAPPAPPPSPPPAPSVTNWFDTHVNDAALRNLGHNLYLDGLITRNDILSLLRNSEDGGVIDPTELSDLRTIAGNSSLFGSLDYVRALTTYVVNNNFANRFYQGTTLGDLAAGNTSAKLENLINKWFLGLDRPTAAGATYRYFSGALFVGGATYSDIHQGSIGDCYFLASLGEVALKNAGLITNMFVVNGDNTYTVRFFNSTGQAHYVTVDNLLPTNGAGQLMYASHGLKFNSTSNELWVALAEKAYAQLNEFGWSRVGSSQSGQNSYDALSGGYIYAALGQISGQATSAFAMTSAPTSFTAFVNAYNAGKMIGFASFTTPVSGSGVVGSHAYAVVGYNAQNQTVTLFNPWGTEYGLITLTWNQIKQNFQYFDRTS